MKAAVRPTAFALLAALLVAGCLAPAATELAPASVTVQEAGALTVHSSFGGGVGDLATVLDDALVPVTAILPTGHRGPEPSLGVTSDGTLFFVAGAKTLRSTDHGATWEVVSPTVTVPDDVPRLGGLTLPPTLDPMLWVDPVTDRVFVDQLYVGCSYLSFSDDLGKTWVTNPAACGLPVNDHQKVTTGRNVGSMPQSSLYPNVVYYAYNGLALGARVSASFDGGLTFTQNAMATPPTCVGGLHGSLVAAPDGTLYLPKRDCGGPSVAVSKDSGATWAAQQIGQDVGTSPCQKNPEVAVDVENGAYMFWPAADDKLYMARSVDGGATWDGTSLPVSPAFLAVTTMPVAAAGDAGRVAVAYYATDALPATKENAEGEKKHGPDTVPEDARWHLWLTTSTNALDADPTWITVRVTPEDDPLQIGPISTNSSGCPAPPGSRNLLDFMDMVVDADGRVFVAYTDGCVDECVTKGAAAKMTDSRSAMGVVAVVDEGPSLFAANTLAKYTAAHGH